MLTDGLKTGEQAPTALRVSRAKLPGIVTNSMCSMQISTATAIARTFPALLTGAWQHLAEATLLPPALKLHAQGELPEHTKHGQMSTQKAVMDSPWPMLTGGRPWMCPPAVNHLPGATPRSSSHWGKAQTCPCGRTFIPLPRYCLPVGTELLESQNRVSAVPLLHQLQNSFLTCCLFGRLSMA